MAAQLAIHPSTSKCRCLFCLFPQQEGTVGCFRNSDSMGIIAWQERVGGLTCGIFSQQSYFP